MKGDYTEELIGIIIMKGKPITLQGKELKGALRRSAHLKEAYPPFLALGLWVRAVLN